MTIEDEIESILRKNGQYLGTGDLKRELKGKIKTDQIRSIVVNDDRFRIKIGLKGSRGQRWEIGLKEWIQIEKLEKRLETLEEKWTRIEKLEKRLKTLEEK